MLTLNKHREQEGKEVFLSYVASGFLPHKADKVDTGDKGERFITPARIAIALPQVYIIVFC